MYRLHCHAFFLSGNQKPLFQIHMRTSYVYARKAFVICVVTVAVFKCRYCVLKSGYIVLALFGREYYFRFSCEWHKVLTHFFEYFIELFVVFGTVFNAVFVVLCCFCVKLFGSFLCFFESVDAIMAPLKITEIIFLFNYLLCFLKIKNTLVCLQLLNKLSKI